MLPKLPRDGVKLGHLHCGANRVNKPAGRKDTMKREDVKKQIPGITDEQLDWLMNENGRDVQREKNTAATLQTQLDEANRQLTTAQDGLKAFEGVNVDELRGKITQLQNDLQAQKDSFAFDNALDGAIRDMGGRNVKAVRGMLDLEALRGSKDRSTDIKNALETLAKDNAWAFDAKPAPGAGSTITVSTGTEMGTGGTAQPANGVEAAFLALNPGLKI